MFYVITVAQYKVTGLKKIPQTNSSKIQQALYFQEKTNSGSSPKNPSGKIWILMAFWNFNWIKTAITSGVSIVLKKTSCNTVVPQGQDLEKAF